MGSDYVHIRVGEGPFEVSKTDVHVVRGREVISQLFEVHVQLVTMEGTEVDLDEAIGAPISLIFEFDREAGKEEIRRYHGIISEISTAYETEDKWTAYDLTIVPRAWRTTLVRSQSIFMGDTVPQIIEKKLELVGLQAGEDFEMRLMADYPEREFVVQYKETDLAFISRLAEHDGIYFFFEHDGGKDKIVFCDTNDRLRNIVGEDTSVPFHRRGEELGIYEWVTKRKMIPSMYAVRDYNYRRAADELLSTHSLDAGDAGAVIEYGTHFKNSTEGDRYAQLRAEESQAQRKVHHAESFESRLSAGAVFDLADHPEVSGRHLVVEVHFEATQSVAHGIGKGDEKDYRNRFVALDVGVPYRAPRITPRPRIHGAITGYVENVALGEIDKFCDIDEWGRYRVRFMYDTSGPEDRLFASRLIRQVMPAGGKDYGWHFPLRKGLEVIMVFIDGDPDRPLIVGAAHNLVTPNPVIHNDQTKNRLKTESGVLFEIEDGGGS